MIHFDMHSVVDARVKQMLGPDAILDGRKVDANETMTFARELEHVYTKIYETEFPALFGRQLCPMNAEGVDPADESATTTEVTGYGQMKPITNWTKDFPGLEEQGKQFTGPIFSWGGSFEYTLMDLRRSARIGRPLVARRAVLARKLGERTLDNLICTGNAALGLQGMASLTTGATGVPIVSKVSTGLWNVQTDFGQILADVTALVSSIPNSTGNDHTADTLALDTVSYNFIRFTKLGNSSNPATQSILQYILQNVDGLKSIVGWNRLNTAGAGGHSRAIAYERSDDVLFHIMAQEFEMFPPQQKGLAFETLCHMRWGGVRVIKPKAIAYMDQTGS